MEETLGNVGTYLDLSKYPGFLPQCLEELCILQTSNGDFFWGVLFLQGVRDYSVPVGLDGKAQVDLVVVGSVAVSEKGEEKLPAEKSQVPVQCQEAEICPWSSGLSSVSVWDKSLLPTPAGSTEMFWPSGKLLRQAILCALKESSLAPGLRSALCERTCVRAADSGPIWGSDFAFSSVLETCWCWKNFPLTLSLA